MMIGDVEERFLRFQDPVIGHFLAAGVAKAGLAGIGHGMFASAPAAGVGRITENSNIPAGHDPADLGNHVRTDQGFMPIIKPTPIVFEDSSDCILTGQYCF